MRQTRQSAYEALSETSTRLTVLQPRQPSVTVGLVAADRRAYFACKRIMDVIIALAFLIIALPVMLVVALLTKVDSAGPVLFKQERVGQGGRRFVFYKFRTMYDGADPDVHRKYVESLMRTQVPDSIYPDGSGPRLYKLTNDHRVTRIGRTLRRTSLDELPQLINVLKGEMSLVGPRPALPYEVSAYRDWHSARLATVPGITGWWQVRGRCRVTFDEMVRMDLDYIAKQSLWLDLKILVLTIPAVVSRRGAL